MLIPTTEPPTLIETSFADGIAIIAASTELPDQTRRHWTTSLRQIAKALDKPPEVIPARYSAVRADFAQLHEAPAGLTAKTLRNHKSNAKSALLWLAREKGIPQHGAPLSPAWEELRPKIRDAVARSRLSSFMRFCSANNIAPGEVDEATIEQFLDYRARCGKPADGPFRRLLARAWNDNIGSIPGLPTRRLKEPLAKAAVELAWEQFPAGLRREVIHIIINSKLTPEFQRTEVSTLKILGRSISVALQSALRAQLAAVLAKARHDGIGIVVASVNQGFSHDSRGAFDPEYMKALFELGFEQGNKTALRGELVSAQVQERGQDISLQEGPKP